MAHQSLYRRYRPRTFAEIKGQQHVVTALRNAVADDSAAHAYMFSGPRGTGKTSTARIFAKALNCTALEGGEPCCECDSCLSIEAGTSFDLFELDAASNNGVDAIRDLVERTMVVSPGRTKVYILDEVHMLTTGASNALLKTLEEPPEHVRFVLATTDPQKVLPTIRSRTQHFEFRLLSAAELSEHARWVSEDAGLDVDEASIAYAVKRGKGSVRDALSALDQVVAAGGVLERSEPVDELFSALAGGSEGAALVAVADAIAQGHDPRVLAEAFVAEVREAFLLSIGVDTPHLVDSDRERLGGWAQKLGSAGLSRTMERIGSALVDMRSAADPRVPLEVALIQLADSSPTAVAPAPPGTRSDAPSSSSNDASVTPDRTGELAELRERVDKLETALSQARDTGTAGSTPTAASRDDERVESAAATSAGRSASSGDNTASRAGNTASSGDNTASSGDNTASRAGNTASSTGRSARPTGKKPAAVQGPAGGRRPPPPPPRKNRSASSGPDARSTPAATGGPGGHAGDATPQESPDTRPATDVPSEPAAAGSADGAGVTSADASSGGLPERDALVIAFGDSVVPKLKGIAKAIYSQGRFVSVAGDHAVFAVENAPTRDRAERYRPEVESLLGAEFATVVPLRLVVEGEEGGNGDTPPGGAVPPSGAGRGPAADGRSDTTGASGSQPSAERSHRQGAPHRGEQHPPQEPDGEQRRGGMHSPERPGGVEPGGVESRSAASLGEDDPGAASGQDDGAGVSSQFEEAEIMAQVSELEDADVQNSTVDRLTAAFPGAELIESEEAT